MKEKTELKSTSDTVRSYLFYLINYENYYQSWIQNKLRSPTLDKIMKNISLLGSTLSFLVIIPSLYLMSETHLGFAYLFTLNMILAVYITNYFKDLFCLPRPQLPVKQLDLIKSHFKEFGFPSTHSTLSISLGFSLVDHLQIYISESMKISLYCFIFVIIFSRYYLGMHSLCDILAGISLGYLIYYNTNYHSSFIFHLLYHKSIISTLFFTPIVSYLFLNLIPPPIKGNCPCFLDSIRVFSLLMGMKLATCYKPISINIIANIMSTQQYVIRLILGYSMFIVIFLITEVGHKIVKLSYLKFSNSSNTEAVNQDDIIAFLKKCTIYIQFYIIGFVVTYFIPHTLNQFNF
ncbi:acid phosphatase/Vanadium-dependent haloperoxidase [Neoconidiobolus thromboides FSU 785]|nr:acid phosphatase/Vanadium-dependent haloperoxidase [Neoconidiobolus thromboides FSU 785]